MALAKHLWLADIASLFRPYLFVASLVLFLLCLIVRNRLTYLLGIVAVLAGTLPLVLVPPTAHSNPGQQLTLLTANLYVDNTEFSGLERFIEDVRPDIILTQETTPLWQKTETFGAYPNKSSMDLQSRDDIQLLSRYPIVSEHVVTGGEGYAGLVRHPVRFEIAMPGQTLIVYAVHPDTLKSPDQWRQRNLYLDLVGEEISHEPPGQTIIVAGDWNTPTWSPFFKDFLVRTVLLSTDDPWWPKPTRISLRLDGLPLSTIDHIVVSRNVGLKSLETGPAYGSNHLPVVAHLTIAQHSAFSGIPSSSAAVLTESRRQRSAIPLESSAYWPPEFPSASPASRCQSPRLFASFMTSPVDASMAKSSREPSAVTISTS